MSNKSRHRRLLFMMGLVLFSLLGSIWISSNNGMTVYADSKTNITQNGTGSGTVINQQEEPQISTVNSNTTDNTSSSDDQASQKQVTNTEAQPRAPTDNNQPVQEDRNYISNSQYSTSNSGANTNQGIVFLRIIVPHLHIIKELALILQLPIRDHQLRRSQVEELQNSLLISQFQIQPNLGIQQLFHYRIS